MMRRVGNALIDLTGDCINRALTLRQQIDDLGPTPAGQRLGDFGKPVEESGFSFSITHGCHRAVKLTLCQVFK